jgi:hypothetical protein
MSAQADDPRAVDVLVVHAEDVVSALAATEQGRETVLRVTPPFRRRQRARIHVPGDADGHPGGSGDGDADAAPLHVPARAFVADDAPGFPRATETEPAPAESSEYDVDEHFDRHATAVEEWRETISTYFRDEVSVDADGVDCWFEVRYLGA